MGILIDGVNILVSDVYRSMTKKDAVAHMLKEGFVPGEDKKAWAEKAYDLINPTKQSPAKLAGPAIKEVANDDRPDHKEHGGTEYL